MDINDTLYETIVCSGVDDESPHIRTYTYIRSLRAVRVRQLCDDAWRV